MNFVNANSSSASSKKTELQKGVQKKTLDKIRVCLSAHPETYLPCEMIALETGLSRVTIIKKDKKIDCAIHTQSIAITSYSTGCRFFKEMSIIGAECVKAPQDT